MDENTNFWPLDFTNVLNIWCLQLVLMDGDRKHHYFTIHHISSSERCLSNHVHISKGYVEFCPCVIFYFIFEIHENLWFVWTQNNYLAFVKLKILLEVRVSKNLYLQIFIFIAVCQNLFNQNQDCYDKIYAVFYASYNILI